MPQSIGPSRIDLDRFCSCGSTFGWTVKPSGKPTMLSAIRRITSGVVAVTRSPAGTGFSG